MTRSLVRSLIVSAMAIGLSMSVSGQAEAELFVSGYLGAASTYDTDVELNRPGGTRLTFKDVSWDDDSFSAPPYYGFRIGYWFKNYPNWAAALDFTHAKMYAELDNTVSVSGTRSSTPVSGQERLGNTFEVLEFSDGHNLLTINGMYRWMGLGTSGHGFLYRLQPYVLAGVGIAVPHVEVTVENDRTFEYQYTGLAAQAGAGLDVDIVRWFSVFVEYQFSYSEIDADLEGGGTLKTDPWTHHVTFGVTFSWLH